MSKFVVLTGCTGLLGRYLLRDLLRADVPVAVLVRPDRLATAEERVAAIIDHWESELARPLPRPVCLTGDLRHEGLGLSAKDREWVAVSCDCFLHNAASLTFVGSQRDQEPWLSNVTGVRNALAFCQDLGIRQFHHVSTAYVCGDRTGLISEDELDLGQGFRNDYERSKLEGEKLVQQASFLDSRTIYRPAIIVGDSRSGYTCSYHNLYRYFQFTELLRQQSGAINGTPWHHPVRLRLTGDERHNLVPVDWTSAVISRIFRTAKLHRLTYHLAPQSATQSRDVEEALAKYFNYYGVSFAGPNGVPDNKATERERFFYEYIGTYQSYLRAEIKFSTTNLQAAALDLPCPRIDVPCLTRLIDFGVRDRWGKQRPKRVMARRT
jgi:nucleoside-diphosphate-sugar epimerase